MSIDRRTVLSVLGLASASAAVAGEDLAKSMLNGSGKPCGYRFAINDKVSAALRRLADDIDAGGTHPQAMELKSSARH